MTNPILAKLAIMIGDHRVSEVDSEIRRYPGLSKELVYAYFKESHANSSWVKFYAERPHALQDNSQP
ncbi:hypothetical protein [Hexartovirus lepeophtheiri]|uniref:Uncharacterized protein n=1 Tax=Lepeophtheirus virus LS24 TaxID=2080823 RepID=A0A3G1NGY3_9MONO|nr:hypothetical protein QKJ68_gp2 [Lepeophtheirus virus LS24]AUZ99696.1 hypothetical protein [Lepeophtheirus virus LS24]